MIAKYSGICKVTGVEIIAGETEITKVKGVWQAKPQTFMGTKPNVHPPSLQRATFEVTDAYGETYTGHCYQYVGQYGHWRIWKLVDSRGAEVDGEKLGFLNRGNRLPSNVGTNAEHCRRFAWRLLNPIHTCEFFGLEGYR